jgi:hypothetical protein
LERKINVLTEERGILCSQLSNSKKHKKRKSSVSDTDDIRKTKVKISDSVSAVLYENSPAVRKRSESNSRERAEKIRTRKHVHKSKYAPESFDNEVTD